MAAKKSKTAEGDYRGLHWESPEELAFLQWAFELVDAGYIDTIERAKSFSLAGPLVSQYIKTTQLKTKVKEEHKEEILLNGHVYTPEYKITWNIDKYQKFVNDSYLDGYNYNNSKNTKPFLVTHEKLGERISYVEVKPPFDQNNMTRLFKINQKWMWDKHKIFVNLIVPQELFEETFTPKAYLFTPTGKNRTITKWKVRSLNEYINN